MRKILTFVLLLLPGVLFSEIPPQPKVYNCNLISTKIKIDGSLDDKAWNDAEWTDLFVDIEGDLQSKPYYNTKVKMVWDEEFLYIGAWLEESDIWANQTQNESVIYYDNDFEVFLDPDGDTHNYLEFEYNALNVWWDLYLSKPYRAGGIPMTDWTCNEKSSAVKIDGSINDPSGPADSYWTIEIAIPFSCMSEVLPSRYVKPKIDEVWRLNFSRVQWKTHVVDGKYKRIDDNEENWVWSPQGKIDMHMPEFWGYVVFVDDSLSISVPYVDEFWETKYILMHLYDAERLFYRNNNTYIENYKELISIDEKYLVKVNSDIEHNRFIFSIIDSGLIWFVNETGKLWSEKL